MAHAGRPARRGFVIGCCVSLWLVCGCLPEIRLATMDDGGPLEDASPLLDARTDLGSPSDGFSDAASRTDKGALAEEAGAGDVPGLAAAVTRRTLVAGGAHACALREGAVWCWGANARGQLGDGTRDGRTMAVRVVGVLAAEDLAAGAEHVCARRSDGGAVCWGHNVLGQLGDGTRVEREGVREVVGVHDAVEIVAGGLHSCVRTTQGSVWCWG